MSRENIPDKAIESILKYKPPFTKRQISGLKSSVGLEQIMQCRYPSYIIGMINHEQQMMQFFNDLQSLTQSFCQDKQKRKQFMIRKICQIFFSAEQKQMLSEILSKQFGNEEQQSGAKTLYKLLSFIYISHEHS